MSLLNYDLTQFLVKGGCQARLVEQSLRRWQRLAFNHLPEVVGWRQARSGPQLLIPACRNRRRPGIWWMWLTAHMKGSMPGTHRFSTEARRWRPRAVVIPSRVSGRAGYSEHADLARPLSPLADIPPALTGGAVVKPPSGSGCEVRACSVRPAISRSGLRHLRCGRWKPWYSPALAPERRCAPSGLQHLVFVPVLW